VRRFRTAALAPLALLAASCGPQVAITHTIPAPHNLGPVKTLVLVEAQGVEGRQNAFVDSLAARTREAGFYEWADARQGRHRLAELREGKRNERAERFRRKYPGDVYVAVELFGGRAHERSEVVKEKEKDDKGEEHEVRKTKYWWAAECEARVEMIDAGDGHELASFRVEGRHESYKTDSHHDYDQDSTEIAAARNAAYEAFRLFTPRRSKEAVDLDKKAPAAKEGIAAVENGRYDEARRLWEDALRTNPGSAGLHYNLGAVCEALGDRASARKHYKEAIRLDPSKKEYGEALDKLEQRSRDSESLRRKD
jgi:tetratricopeptide (TPR) repeat protein